MSKKYLFGMFAAASLLFATSCSDELDSGNAGNMATVSFKIGVENGAQSRAISDGTKADKLIYAVFDENGNRITTMEQVVKENVTFPTTETITLAKGQSYKIAFWAQDGSCTAYTVDNNMTLEIDYNGINNDENRDAFFKTIDVTMLNNSPSTQEGEVVLKRPFAQLNVGVTKADWEAARKSGVVIEMSDVTISNVASRMNLVTGTIMETKKDILYSQHTIPAQWLTLTNDEDGDNKDGDENDGDIEEFHYLSMSYILVDDDTEGGANRALINNVSFNFYPQSGNVINFSEGLNNIPVQRNWRTNIVGKLLTSDVDYTISIDPGYNGEINIDGTIYASTTEEDLATILSRGGVVTIKSAPTATEGVIDLTGLTLADDLYLVVAEGANLKGLNLGGNNTDTEKPTVTVEIQGEYPETITFADGTENVILKGNTDKTYGSNFVLQNAKNITISGINSDFMNVNNGWLYTIDISGESENITVENCIVSNLGQRFVNVQKAKNVTIQNNNITSLDGTCNEGYTHPQRPIEVQNTENVTIKGNTFINSMEKQAMWINQCNTVLITDNTITNAYTDGIKVDNAQNVTITNNTVTAKENGIRLDWCNDNVIAVITDNTVSANANNGDDFYGINLNESSDKSVDGTLTIKNNKIGEIGKNNYFYLGNTLKPETVSDYENPFSVAEGVTIMANGSYGLLNAKGMLWFAEQVNAGSTFGGKAVMLAADIDMSDVEWKPIGDVEDTSSEGDFTGVFDGNYKTISNLTVSDKSQIHAAAGLFGVVHGTIKNLTLKNVTITSSHYAGAIAAYSSSENMVIENCHVDGGTITSTPEKIGESYDNGDKAGGIIGYMTTGKISGCSVKDVTITAYRDLGGIVGCSSGIIENNEVGNTTITANQLVAYKEKKDANAGEFLGRNEGATLSDNTSVGVTVNILKADENGKVEVGAVALSALSSIANTEVQELVFTEDIEGKAEGNGGGYGVTGISHSNGCVLDGQGNTLTVTEANGTWESALYTKGGTIKNLNIEGGFRGIFIANETKKVIIDNVTINPVAYTISVDGGNGNGLEVTNSTLNGWTSFSAGIGEVSFEKCNFGSNGSYAFMRPYAITTLKDCSFSEGYELDANYSTSITLENCKVGETVITAENLTTLLGEAAAGAIVK